MKNKKGFTLIELLAVIVILAIIALIAVPVILNIIDKSNKSAFKDTAYGIISAGELYFAENQLDINGMQEDEEFILPDDANTEDGIQINGEVPTGVLKVNTEGKVALAIQNGRYCVTKGYDDTDVTLTEDVENCVIPVPITEMIITSSTDLSLAVGETSTIEVSIAPDNATKTKLNYISSDESVVTISETGVITAAAAGSATITVTTTDGSDISRTINVTVKQPVEGLNVGSGMIELNTNQTYQIVPKITPENA